MMSNKTFINDTAQITAGVKSAAVLNSSTLDPAVNGTGSFIDRSLTTSVIPEVTTQSSSLTAFIGNIGISQSTTLPTATQWFSNASASANTTPASDEDGDVTHIIGACVLTVLAAVMLFGNLMALITIYGSQRLRRKPKYLFVVNLATADLVWSILLMPWAAVWEFTDVWIFGSFLCDVYNVVDIGVSAVSTYSLLLISVNQYISISRPLRYPSIVSKRRVVAVITTVWVVWISFAIVSVFGRLYVDPSLDMGAIDDPCLFVMNKPYAIVTAFITFIVPFLVLLTFSVRIMVITNQHVRRFNKDNIFGSPSSPSAVSTPRGTRFTAREKSKTAENRTHQSPVSRSSSVPNRKVSWRGIALLITVVISFMVLSAPYYITTVVNAICDCVDADVYDNYLVYLYYMNPLVNPYIYIAADSQYRTAMVRKFGRHKRPRDYSASMSNKPTPETFTSTLQDTPVDGGAFARVNHM